MTTENKNELGKFIIQRYDHYYDTINNKCAFYIALNTFILGSLCTGYISLYKDLTSSIWLCAFATLHLLCCLGSIFYTIFAMIPFTKDNYANDNSTSLIFFGDVTKHPFQYFKQKFLALDEATLQDDLARQVHCLAKGLSIKFARLKVASWLLIIQFTLLLPFIFFIIKNYKQ